MKSILKTACTAGIGLLIVGGTVLGGQVAMADDQPVTPDSSTTTTSTSGTERVSSPQLVRGYLGRATQTAATGVTPGSEIKEGAVVQLVNDEQIDGVLDCAQLFGRVGLAGAPVG